MNSMIFIFLIILVRILKKNKDFSFKNQKFTPFFYIKMQSLHFGT